MTQAERTISLEYLAWLKEEAARANSSYDAARKAYKRQQKNAHKRAMTTTMSKFCMDYAEAKNEGTIL